MYEMRVCCITELIAVRSEYHYAVDALEKMMMLSVDAKLSSRIRYNAHDMWVNPETNVNDLATTRLEDVQLRQSMSAATENIRITKKQDQKLGIILCKTLALC